MERCNISNGDADKLYKICFERLVREFSLDLKYDRNCKDYVFTDEEIRITYENLVCRFLSQ